MFLLWIATTLQQQRDRIISLNQQFHSKFLFENFGDWVKYWMTINEQNCMINHPDDKNPGRVPTKKELYQQNHQLLLVSESDSDKWKKYVKK